jgi:hypothetical protein
MHPNKALITPYKSPVACSRCAVTLPMHQHHQIKDHPKLNIHNHHSIPGIYLSLPARSIHHLLQDLCQGGSYPSWHQWSKTLVILHREKRTLIKWNEQFFVFAGAFPSEPVFPAFSATS